MSERSYFVGAAFAIGGLVVLTTSPSWGMPREPLIVVAVCAGIAIAIGVLTFGVTVYRALYR